ncbi:MAG: HetZ-related protein [Kastovskya adunca ATA6-11-RM4]|jgi:hypothetical protein|nr:HetZ-related protein [Kastovskya adunca ATA6-11-RM4]
MNVKIANLNHTSDNHLHSPEDLSGDPDTWTIKQLLLEELQSAVGSTSRSVEAVANRMAQEVERICCKSMRIQNSGQVRSWQVTLGRHRLQKCLLYYQLGSKQGRVELHSNLSVMVYRHIALAQSQLKFAARCNLIEDFLQNFYAESLKAFRRENDVASDYTPRTQLELAEYMAFTEQYAKRRISLRNHVTQQLIVLRAQSFARRQPEDMVLDIEQAVEFDRSEDLAKSRSAALQQVRSQMVADTTDPSEAVLRDRVVSELMHYLEEQGHSDCADYLALKLKDLCATDIEEILGLTPRQRDYLQQRFKYHVEKFARSSNWRLVHQWLGADLDQKLGMSSDQWEAFIAQLSPQQQQLLQLKQSLGNDEEIAQTLRCTLKQVKKRWTQLLELAWKTRNTAMEENN